MVEHLGCKGLKALIRQVFSKPTVEHVMFSIWRAAAVDPLFCNLATILIDKQFKC